MSASVESMFSVREVPWHGLGTIVEEAPNAAEAIKLAGLDWVVVQREIKDSVTDEVIPRFMANVRESDNRVLGIVNDKRYQICQNVDAFEFTDKLVDSGEVHYETAGSLLGGRKIWLLAKLPGREIMGEDYIPYLVFTNSHDGTSGVRAAITPVRVVCNNTLNLALKEANRTWSCGHRGDLQGKLIEATNTLKLSSWYLKNLDVKFQKLSKVGVDEVKAVRLIETLLPIKIDDGSRKVENVKEMRNDILLRFKESPDLSEMGNNGYKFLNAVSDFSIHTDLHQKTKYYNENRFLKVISGGSLLIDKATKILEGDEDYLRRA